MVATQPVRFYSQNSILAKSLTKLQKNRGKSKKDDQKRISLESEIIDKKKQLENYAQHNLKKSTTK